MMHYHGTPISPRATFQTLAGRNFCVSYAKPQDIKQAHQIAQSVMLDNGAFSVWQMGRVMDWERWRAWAEPWLDTPTTWCVLPDSIEGGERENDELLDRYADVRRGVPVWHLHESLERLCALVERFGKVCFGSSGDYATVGSIAWRRRTGQAFDAIADVEGRVPWVHMLRGMSMCGDIYPFASVDSTDVARNHNRPQNTARAMIERWDAIQCPRLWQRVEQLELVSA